MERVRRLVEYVHDTIAHDPVAPTTTLLDVLELRRGDVRERAALFTALARALAIPTRNVYGLVHPGGKARHLRSHVWNEVVIDDRWLPVDPNLGQMTIDATHMAFYDRARPDGGHVIGGDVDKGPWLRVLSVSDVVVGH
jgi:transglutaminase-like putative cysteine protease